MLSRVADSIYWMSRYVERAENVARFIDVNVQLMLDTSPQQEQQWQPLVHATADQAGFAQRYGRAAEDKVLAFLTFDLENPNSILSCLRAARENARAVREVISSAMWQQLNTSYLVAQSAAGRPMDLDLASEFLQGVRLASQQFTGITDTTMSHGMAWHFSQIGRMLERADKTSRLLDLKYYILLRGPEEVGTSFDHIQWGAVLRSASAFEMYCKQYGKISPSGVIEFLMLDREFPRSVQFCLRSARDSLHLLSGTPHGTFRFAPEKLLGRLCSDLAFITVEDIIRRGLHEYIDQLQTRLNQTGQAIQERFFSFRLPEQKGAAALAATHSQ